jgi:mevalonate pyrophosphate decarboxylase
MADGAKVAGTIIQGVGTGASIVGDIYDIWQGGKRQKSAEDYANKNWLNERQSMLMQMAEKKRKDEWRRKFMGALSQTFGQQTPQQAPAGGLI